MKQLTTFIIFLFFLSSGLKAQSLWKMFPSNSIFGRQHLTLKQIQGSPYLNPEYVNGTVIDSDGKVTKDIPLRYNCYSDVLEYKKEDKNYDILPKEQVVRADFGDHTFCYIEYEDESGNTSNKGYFQILTDDKASLFVKYHISFYEREEVKGYSEPKPDRFDNLTLTYWISFNKGPAKRILNKSKIQDIFPDKKNEMQIYISNQKLSFKKADDLKKIVSYYNTL